MPGQKISKDDRVKIDSKFICIKCDLLLHEPMQTLCGHLMCKSCLHEILTTPNPICPKDGTKLLKDQIFLDAFTKRELAILHLHCSNSDCDWSGSNKELQDHFNCCDHSLIQCVHEQCNKEIKRSLLAQHLEKDCSYRLVSCTYCKEQLAFISMKEHVQLNCLSTPLTCKYCGTAGIPRSEMNKHEAMVCEEIAVECVFKSIGCTHTKVAKRKELRQHCGEELTYHVQLLLSFNEEMSREIQRLAPNVELAATMERALEDLKRLTGSLSADVENLAEKFTSILLVVRGLQTKFVKLESGDREAKGKARIPPDVEGAESEPSNMRKRLEKLEEKNAKLENEVKEKASTIERLNAKLEQFDHSMALTTVRLSDLEISNQAQPMSSHNGTLLWKIDGFNRKRQDAVNGTQAAIYSPPFYSNQFGYKMCVRIYPNGDGFGKDTHISLFFVVMKGEYDALLSWPFQKKITMMMMDQVNGDHMIDAFRSDAESSSFQRPKNNMNIASGSPLFMPLADLNNRGYVKDDTMFVKIIVD